MHKNTEYFSLVLLPLFRHCQFVLDSNSFFSIFGWINSSLLKLSYSFRFVIYQIKATKYLKKTKTKSTLIVNLKTVLSFLSFVYLDSRRNKI